MRWTSHILNGSKHSKLFHKRENPINSTVLMQPGTSSSVIDNMFKPSLLCVLIVIQTLLFHTTLSAQTEELHFRHYTTVDGLSQSSVLCFEQDSRGFLWFGTYYGLNRFDGYEFKIFQADPTDSSSISHSLVGAIHEDHKGTLWVGTDDGLDIYNSNFEIFTHLRHDPQDNTSLSHNVVRAIFEDSQNRLWVGSRGGGLNLYDPEIGGFKHYFYDPDDASSISHNTISDIIEDPRGCLWIATDGGLNRYDFESKQFTRFTHDPSNSASVSLNNVYRLFLEDSGALWVGTWLGGLNRFDPETGIFHHYDLSNGNGKDAGANIIRAIEKDSNGDLWVGTWGAGIYRYIPEQDKFISFRKDVSDPASISSDQITAIFHDKSGGLWVGTDFGGLNKRKLDSEKFKHYHTTPASLKNANNENVRALLVSGENDIWIGSADGLHHIHGKAGTYSAYYSDDSDPYSISNNSIRSLFLDSKGNIWAGTESGLNRYNSATDNFTCYFFSPRITGEEPVDMCWTINEDHEGMIWIGTFGGGLIRLDPSTDEFSIYVNDKNDPASLQNNSIWCIIEDHENKLWIGTDNGLEQLETNRHIFPSLPTETDLQKSLHNSKVLSLFQDMNNNIWIGTSSGLYFFDFESELLSRFTTEDGLSSNNIQAITPGNPGSLWLSTSSGVSEFNTLSKSFKNYSVEDGLQGIEFHVNANAVGPDGKIYLGGINGYNVFHPNSISASQYQPNIYLTDFQVFNSSVPIGAKLSDRVILNQSLINTEHIDLTYNENVFSLSYAALDFYASEKLNYAYRMEGFESEWNNVGDRRFATYTNLDPGDYTFIVKATNSDGVWSDKHLNIGISIAPPFWETWWFLTLVTLTIIGLIYSLIQYRLRLLHIRTRVLQAEVEKQTVDLVSMNQELQQTDMMKELLLDIITHDLKNPIGVVNSLSDYMLAEDPDNHELQVIRSSSRSVLQVMANATTLARVSMNEEINKEELDLCEILSDTVDNFMPLLKENNIEVENRIQQKTVILANPIIEEVFKNFISNAIKYAAEGKHLIIDQSKGDNSLEVSVIDFGTTIPENKRKAIFLRSVQLEEGKKRGHGLGLAIVKRIAEAHKAQIGVKPNIPTGNIFFIKIPCAS